MRIVGTSGHRDFVNMELMREMAHKCIREAKEKRYLAISCGGSMYQDYKKREEGGWDYYIMEACIIYDFPLILRLPFPSFYVSEKFLVFAKQTTDEITYKYTKSNYEKQESWRFSKALLDRNQDIVDDAIAMGIFWDGRRKGGTFDTLKKAREKKIPIKNYFPSPLLTNLERIRDGESIKKREEEMFDAFAQ